jgi:hypothetical protein
MMQKLFFMIFIMSSLAHNCYAAENNKKYKSELTTQNKQQNGEWIKLDNKGLLTKVSASLVTIIRKNDVSQKYYVTQIAPNETKDRLTNLIATQYATVRCCNCFTCNNRSICSYNDKIFCPAVIKIKKNGTLKNLGLFCRTKHQEAIEVCRLKHAMFYAYKVGAIIYTFRSEKTIVDPIETEKIIDCNLITAYNEGIDLKLPVIFDTSMTHQ